MPPTIWDVNTVFGFWPKRKADIRLETLLGLIASKGIERACTLSARGIFYDFIEGNAETLDAARDHPALIPVGTLNPCRWLGCLDETRHLIDKGVRIFRFFPHYQEWSIDQAPFLELLDKVLAPAGVILMLPAQMGFTAIARMAATVDNPIIIDSFRYASLAEAIVVMQKSPNLYIETHMINSPNWVELLAQNVGTDRIIFGSNAPLSYFTAASAQIENAMAPEKDKNLIFAGNLSRLLGET